MKFYHILLSFISFHLLIQDLHSTLQTRFPLDFCHLALKNKQARKNPFFSPSFYCQRKYWPDRSSGGPYLYHPSFSPWRRQRATSHTCISSSSLFCPPATGGCQTPDKAAQTDGVSLAGNTPSPTAQSSLLSLILLWAGLWTRWFPEAPFYSSILC